MKFITPAMWKNYTKDEKRKINQNFNQMKYRENNKGYYSKYQKNHYSINKKHRCRTMKALYYKKTYNKEIIWIKPPPNYEEVMEKLNLKIKYG